MHTKKVSPFDHEYEERAITGKTTEQIIKNLQIGLANVILSHLAIGVVEKLTEDPKELLENLLHPTTLESITRESPEDFLVDNLVKVLEALWNKDATGTNSVNETRALGHCLTLKQIGYTVNDAVEVVCKHFSLPNPLISSPVH